MSLRNQIEIFKRTDGKFDFRFIAAENGNVICSSNQGYDDRAEAMRMAARVINAGPSVAITFSES